MNNIQLVRAYDQAHSALWVHGRVAECASCQAGEECLTRNILATDVERTRPAMELALLETCFA